jgi:Fic family protein
VEIDRYRPFSEHTINQLRHYFRIGLTWSSNALEGNTLTESETKAILEDGLTVSGKPLREHLEALGHADAFDSILILKCGLLMSGSYQSPKICTRSSGP